MKRSVVLGILLLLAAVLAGGAYWLKTRDRGKTAAGATSAGSDAGASVASSAKQPAGKESAAPPTDLSLRYDDDPKGTLRLEGQVVDADEQPVGGVTVAIGSNPPRQVQTEADGSFAFDQLLQRGYELEAHKDDQHAGPTNVNVVARTEPVTLRLVTGVTLEVTVQDGDSKKPIGGARVEARGISLQEASAGADGVARLRGLGGGWVQVKVAASGYAPSFEVFQLSRQPGAVVQQTVLLRRGVAVAGRVVDDAGKPIVGARVLPVSSSSLWGGASERLDAVESDGQGKWKMASVAPGSWRFEATHEQHAPGQSASVILEAGKPAPEVVITMAPAGSIAGEVHSASGQPVPFATVRVSAASAGFDFGETRQASCDDSGHFTVNGLPRRTVSVLAAHESGSSDVTTLDLEARPEQKNLILVLSQDGAIAGTVVTPAGQPVAEARVIALPELGEGDSAGETTRWQLLGSVSDVADQAGAFRISGLPKGKYRLRAMRQEASMQDPATWQRKGEVAATGATGVRVTLEDDAVLKGKIAFKDGHAPDVFTVGTSAWGTPTPFTSKTGEFRLEHVAPGSRMLTVSGPGFARKTTDPIEAKAGVETDVGTITVERGRTVRGKVVRGDGSPVEGATVLAGPRFFGTGDSIRGPGGGGGSGAAFGTKDAQTDKQGRFEIPGLGVKNMLLVADHDYGRSATLPIGVGEADVNVTLTLLKCGSVEGKVLNGKTPVPGVPILAQAQSAFRGQFIIKAGDDGVFRFDKLAPDTYLVSAVQPQGIGAVNMHTEVVKVESEKTAHVDLQLIKTDLSLTVAVETLDHKPVKSAVAFVMGGLVDAHTAIEVEQALAAHGAGGFQQAMLMNAQPNKFANLVPGSWSVCILPVAGDLNDSSDTEKLMKDPDVLPVTCKPVVVAPSPNDQSVTIQVSVPKP